MYKKAGGSVTYLAGGTIKTPHSAVNTLTQQTPLVNVSLFTNQHKDAAMTAKYIEIGLSKGKRVWRFKPKKHVRLALGITGESFSTESEANRHSNTVQVAYEEWKRRDSKKITIDESTVDGLIAYYFTTSEFKDLKFNSKEHYRLVLKTACDTCLDTNSKPFGKLMHKYVTMAQADKLKQKLIENVSEHRAVHALKCLRRVWYVGMRHEKVHTNNPFFKMGIKSLKRRQKRWSEEEIATFVRQADKLGYEGIGTMALLCWHMCQRPGDMRQLTWSNYVDGILRFDQEKTGSPMSIPVTPLIAERLQTIKRSPSTDCIVFYGKTGKPYDRRLYNDHAKNIRMAAKLDDELKLSDLRRTGATEMANSGCTDDEMRSVTGHKTRDVLGIYLVLDENAATNAMSKRFG